jgi:hypothetical protein
VSQGGIQQQEGRGAEELTKARRAAAPREDTPTHRAARGSTSEKSLLLEPDSLAAAPVVQSVCWGPGPTGLRVRLEGRFEAT